MGTRVQLQTLLETITSSVYYQPPETVKISYPCIIYTLDKSNTRFASDKPYNIHLGYTVTVIDKNPDSNIPEEVAMLSKCIFNRHYTADNLHHFVFTIYY
jgi:hypothetical protein